MVAMNPYVAYENHLKNDYSKKDEEWKKKYSAHNLNNWNIVNVAGIT